MLEWMSDIETLQRNDNKFWKQARKVYYVQDAATDNSVVGGYYRSDSRFTFLSVPKAGHFVPTTNMATTRQFLRDYLSPQRELGCYNDKRKAANGCSTADIMCDFMSVPSEGTIPLACSGHGSCDSKFSGLCTCEKGYRGADCSDKYEVLVGDYFQTFYFTGSRNYFFQYQGSDDFELILSNANPMDVYINAGSTDPN